jgi:hypothetical protein
MYYWDSYTGKTLKEDLNNYYIRILSEDGYKIRFISNRTRELQQVAIDFYIKSQYNVSNVLKYFDFDLISNKLNFENIDSPKDKNWIRFIHKPTEGQQLESVLENPLSLMYIDFASESVEIKAVELNTYDCIRYCKYESAIRTALQTDGLSILWLDDPSDQYQVLALDQNPGALRYIKNPSINAQNFFIEKLLNIMLNQKDNKKEMKMYNEFSKKLNNDIKQSFLNRLKA